MTARHDVETAQELAVRHDDGRRARVEALPTVDGDRDVTRAVPRTQPVRRRPDHEHVQRDEVVRAHSVDRQLGDSRCGWRRGPRGDAERPGDVGVRVGDEAHPDSGAARRPGGRAPRRRRGTRRRPVPRPGGPTARPCGSRDQGARGGHHAAEARVRPPSGPPARPGVGGDVGDLARAGRWAASSFRTKSPPVSSSSASTSARSSPRAHSCGAAVNPGSGGGSPGRRASSSAPRASRRPARSAGAAPTRGSATARRGRGRRRRDARRSYVKHEVTAASSGHSSPSSMPSRIDSREQQVAFRVEPERSSPGGVSAQPST